MLAIANVANAQLEEIVVTAQKREQSLNDVSVTVAAIGGDQIEQLRVGNMVDLTNVVPGLDITNSIGGTNPRISLRGVGLNDFNPNNNPSVGVYVDEVFQVSPATLGFMMFDLDRVEVLKGPQGTLYGRNSNGGAINIVTVGPSEEQEGYVKVGYGDYETLEFEGAIGGAFSDNVFGRLSVRYLDQGETYYDGEQTGENFGDSNSLGVRAQIGGVSASGWDANLKIEFATDESPRHPSKSDPILTQDGFFGPGRCAAALAGLSDRTQCDDALGFLTPGASGLLIADDTADPWLRTEPFAASKPTDTDVDSVSATLRVSKEFDEVSFTSVTGYLANERTYSEGNISEVEAAGIFRDEEISGFSQEFRLDGSSDKAEWVAGVFFSRDDVD
jgi:iron complex outermembrane receptor protein